MTLKEFNHLKEVDLDVVEDEDFALIVKLFDAWFDGKVQNQPIRSGARFTCEIGHSKYAEAQDAWLRIMTGA